jgi:hypothetical protein
MHWPQVVMIVIMTLKFVGPIARCYNPDFTIKPSAPGINLCGVALYTATVWAVLSYGGFWS